MPENGKEEPVIEESPVFSLKDFEFTRTLSNNANQKLIFVLGTCNEQQAIIILEKIAFTDEQFTSADSNLLKSCVLDQIFKNDIYQNNFCTVDSSLNSKFSSLIIL